MASTADCKILLDTDLAVQAAGGHGPWVRLSKRKAPDGVERVFGNRAQTCFVRVLEQGTALKVDRVATTLEGLEAPPTPLPTGTPTPSLFDRFPPSSHELRAHGVTRADFSGRIFLAAAEGEEMSDDEIAFYCGFETASGYLWSEASETIETMLEALFPEHLDRLSLNDSEGQHTWTLEVGEDRVAAMQWLFNHLLAAGATWHGEVPEGVTLTPSQPAALLEDEADSVSLYDRFRLSAQDMAHYRLKETEFSGRFFFEFHDDPDEDEVGFYCDLEMADGKLWDQGSPGSDDMLRELFAEHLDQLEIGAAEGYHVWTLGPGEDKDAVRDYIFETLASHGAFVRSKRLAFQANASPHGQPSDTDNDEPSSGMRAWVSSAEPLPCVTLQLYPADYGLTDSALKEMLQDEVDVEGLTGPQLRLRYRAIYPILTLLYGEDEASAHHDNDPGFGMYFSPSEEPMMVADTPMPASSAILTWLLGDLDLELELAESCHRIALLPGESWDAVRELVHTRLTEGGYFDNIPLKAMPVDSRVWEPRVVQEEDELVCIIQMSALDGPQVVVFDHESLDATTQHALRVQAQAQGWPLSTVVGGSPAAQAWLALNPATPPGTVYVAAEGQLSSQHDAHGPTAAFNAQLVPGPAPRRPKF